MVASVPTRFATVCQMSNGYSEKTDQSMFPKDLMRELQGDIQIDYAKPARQRDHIGDGNLLARGGSLLKSWPSHGISANRANPLKSRTEKIAMTTKLNMNCSLCESKSSSLEKGLTRKCIKNVNAKNKITPSTQNASISAL